MDATAWLLLVVFLAVAALDWAAVHSGSKALEYVAKPGCMVALIGCAAALDPADEAARTALLIALVLSTIGDVFLMVRGENPRLFLGGLASFLAAHVAYVVGFWLDGVQGAGLVVGTALALALVVFVGRPIVVAVRAGDEPEMAAPVAAYVAVISAMVLSAAGTGDPRAIAGAVLFAGSDSLIARNRFVRTAPEAQAGGASASEPAGDGPGAQPRASTEAWMPLAIIVTYHLAQALLVVAFAQGTG